MPVAVNCVHPPVQGHRLRIGHPAAKQEDHDRGGRGGGQIGKDRSEIQDQVDPQPESRSRRSPEFSGEDGLAGVEGIATDLDVVEALGQDAEGGQPQQRAPIAGRHQRTQQPLAAADGSRPRDQAGTQEGIPVAPVEPGSVDQLAGIPPRHLPGTRMGRNETGWGRGVPGVPGAAGALPAPDGHRMSGCCHRSWDFFVLTIGVQTRSGDSWSANTAELALEVYYRVLSVPKEPHTRPSHPRSTPLPIGFSRGRSWELLRGAFEMYGVIWFAENQ